MHYSLLSMNSLGRKLLLRPVSDNGFIFLNLLLVTVVSYLCRCQDDSHCCNRCQLECFV